MKKILQLLATAVLALTFVSCSSDDDEVAPKQAAFIGNWKTYSQHFTMLKNGNIVEEETSYYTEEDYMLWSFRNDYTFTDVTVEEAEANTYIGTWFSSGNKLYMNYKDVDMGYEWTDDYTISSCNSSTFIIQFTETETVGNITYDYITEYTFKKQN